ncbi:DUF4214 domain-containing protein [Bdellovibrio bacteriovorus]|uniref:DUF4214 domain-containing protein n=1 Tax=Bdellovibrio bacteriovorus (strain ATCC 15356 / DSM 50701 / NCIMB 9529 / HD100) TaxID=264462 RepID=Q6MR49_BDEBA|nr:DUF4214 domain-containing protein [Bdellovibrio bacteriovorus]CAE77909.1 hypothetical protein predicted by Glimmer/Critica [Bdellovibrio bacteriovorus HD100]
MKQLISNQKGFSMANVLIAAGLAGLVSVGSMALVSTAKNLEQSASSSFGKINLQQDARRIFSDKTVCSQKIKLDPADNIHDGRSKLFVTIGGTEIGKDPNAARNLYGLTDVVFSLDGITLIEPIPGSPNRLFKGQLSFQSSKKGDLVGGKTNKSTDMGSLLFEVNASNQMASCFSDISVEGSCRMMGGVYRPTSDPACSVPPACPTGQILVSRGPNQPGNCEVPPVRVEYVTQTVYVASSGGSGSGGGGSGNGSSGGSGNMCATNPAICTAYREILGREPDKEGFEYWNAVNKGNKYDPGESLQTIRNEIANSPEAAEKKKAGK